LLLNSARLGLWLCVLPPMAVWLCGCPAVGCGCGAVRGAEAGAGAGSAAAGEGKRLGWAGEWTDE